MNIKKFYLKLKDIDNINLNINKDNIELRKNKSIMSRGPFISEKISNYINNNLKYKYILKFKYKKINIIVRYYCKEKKNNIKNLLKIVIERIVFMMRIVNKYVDTNIYIYDTPFKKRLPCSKMKECKCNLTIDNINTGYSWGNNIVIYIKEYLIKLIIHEMIFII